MLKQYLSQKLSQKMSPQQIQFIRLLQLSTLDFEEKVEQELLENAALEAGEEFSEKDKAKDEEKESKEEDIDISDFLENDNFGGSSFSLSDDPNQDDKDIPYASAQTFGEYLRDQAKAAFKTEEDLMLSKYLIGCIEDDGYLRRDTKAIVNDLSFREYITVTEEKLESVLTKIKSFDPAGVAAKDLKECLIIQLKRKKSDENPSIAVAIQILEKQMEAFTKKHYKKIIKSLKITEETLKNAINEITRLNPKPGQTSMSTTRAQYIIPDFILKREGEHLRIRLNSKNAPELHINRVFTNTLLSYQENKKNKKSDKKANKKIKDEVQYIKQKLDGAKWFIDSVKQRQNTLMMTMKAILERQNDFFFSGNEMDLKPMILKDVADMVNLDISTISRVVNSKYVDTSYGIYSLKYFFSESITNSKGEEISNKSVKKILQTAIDNEDKSKPLPDEKLTEILKEKGYKIARRTVAKYREQLNLPVARLRKKI